MDKYIKLETIGRGTYGNVLLVKSLEDNKRYALKRICIDNDEKQTEKIQNEIAILKTLDHPNIAKYYESFMYKKKFCIVIEYADSGDLSHIIKKHKAEKIIINEEQIWDWFFQIATALKYIHSKKIIHRDIKAQNIFLTKKSEIKLGDFGVSKILENTLDFAKTSLGTPYFLSPEICTGSVYNNKSDAWMLGCVIYELCSMKKPFEGENFHDLMKNIVSKQHLPIPKYYSSDLVKVVDLLLEKNSNIRLSVNELLEMEFIEPKFKAYIIKKEIDRKNDIINNTVNTNNTIYNHLQKNNVPFINSGEKVIKEVKRIKIPRNPKNKLIIDTEENEIISKQFNKEIINKSTPLEANIPLESRCIKKPGRNSPSCGNYEVQKILSNIQATPSLTPSTQQSRKRRESLGSMNLKSIYSDPMLLNDCSANTSMITKFEDNFSSNNSQNLNRNRNNSNVEEKSTFQKNDSKTKISLIKIPQYKANGFKSKVGKVSIDISSVQSPEHKAIYRVDNISISQHKSDISSGYKENVLLENLSLNKESSNSLEKQYVSNEIILDFSSNLTTKNQKISEIIKTNSASSHNPVLMMDFLKRKIGTENFDILIDKIDHSENPLEFINTSEFMKNLLGKDYLQAANICKIILNLNRTPHSTNSTGASFSTKNSFSNVN